MYGGGEGVCGAGGGGVMVCVGESPGGINFKENLRERTKY